MPSLLDPTLAPLRSVLREFDSTLLAFDVWLAVPYYLALAVLSVYGLHRLHLLWLARRSARPTDPVRSLAPAPPQGGTAADPMPPSVTVQLPLYNERWVAARLIDAVARLRHPADRLQIQVLDDSTDETSAVVSARVARWQEDGIDIVHLRRTERSGYKAGALAAGLETASGEFVAVFDADFVPAPDFLERCLPAFAADPGLGMVQARWDHLNGSESLLTRIQALLLDGHFLVEQAARSSAGLFFNFNGTAGIWRRRAIDEGGGWQHDTVTEDLDLSYRSQLAGWRFRFLPEVGVQAELPSSLAAYRGQQRRWTRGSAQTLRKLGADLLRAPVGLRRRTEALLHLGANLGYPLTVLVALLLPPVVYARHLGGEPLLLHADIGLLLAGTVSLCIFYLAAGRRRGDPAARTLLLLAPLLALCMGMAWHNARATIAGLRRPGGEFERTPKGAYVAHRRFPWAETALTLYLGCAALLLAAAGALTGLPFVLLFLCGFASSAAVLWRRPRRRGTATVVTESPAGELG